MCVRAIMPIGAIAYSIVTAAASIVSPWHASSASPANPVTKSLIPTPICVPHRPRRAPGVIVVARPSALAQRVYVL